MDGSPPAPLKKTLLLVNQFVIDTTRFLNHFSTLVEEKLQKVSHDVARIETSLVLLESRLSTIEGEWLKISCVCVTQLLAPRRRWAPHCRRGVAHDNTCS